MGIEERIDELVRAGWGVVDSGFNPLAFQDWRLKAFECINAMVGPNHLYTKYFERFTAEGDRKNALTAGGVVVTVSEESAAAQLVA